MKRCKVHFLRATHACTSLSRTFSSVAAFWPPGIFPEISLAEPLGPSLAFLTQRSECIGPQPTCFLVGNLEFSCVSPILIACFNCSWIAPVSMNPTLSGRATARVPVTVFCQASRYILSLCVKVQSRFLKYVRSVSSKNSSQLNPCIRCTGTSASRCMILLMWCSIFNFKYLVYQSVAPIKVFASTAALCPCN